MATDSGVNTGFAKCFILFMAVVILLQGVVYLGLAIWGITFISNCPDETTDVAAKPFQFALDLIYFTSQDCPYPSVTVPAVGQAIEIPIDWSRSEVVTNRLEIFMIVYAVVMALWIVTSLLVLATICGPVTRMASAICFWPWFLIVIAGSILDAVATGYHIHDIVHTTSAEETFEYIGAQVGNELMIFIEQFSAYFVTPAVVMTCISSRVVLIWLLNIFGASFCLSLSRVLSSQKKKPVPIEPREREFIPATTYQGSQESRPAVVVAAIQSAPQPQQAVFDDQYPSQIRPKPLPINVVAAPVQRQQSERPVQSPVPAVYPLTPSAPSPEAQPPTVNRQSSAAPNDMITYRSTDSHPDRLDYPASTPTSPPQLSVVSPLNNRYSTPSGDTYAYPSRESQQQQPQRASEELRGQLPWSYTSVLGGKPQPPRKPQQQMQIYPEIPEPDYHEEEGSNANGQQAYSRW